MQQKAETKMPAIPASAMEQVRPPTAREVLRIADALDEAMKDGRFRAGKSDRSIGAELDLPAALVAKVREDLFGPLKENPEVAALRADIGDMQAILDDLKSRLSKLEGV